MRLREATFAGGCFWCTEAIFKRLAGVRSVVSGYSGGSFEHPTYEQVCSGETGHAEAVQVTFDPSVITYEQLCEVFFGTHDPTQLDRQGSDVGEQYRSAIFYHDDDQKKTAEAVKHRLEESRLYHAPLVTEIVPYERFFPAEDSHQHYAEKNAGAPYCRAVIDPKVAKFRSRFTRLLKTEA